MARPCGPTRPRDELFWSKVVKSDGCWLWTGALYGVGYGRIWYQGRHIGTHRFAYEYLVGPIAEGLFVCHHCDVRACVRPDHLFVGTCADNLADMAAKGRAKNCARVRPWRLARGERVKSAKLNRLAVTEIRALYATGAISQPKLAAQFGMSRSVIGSIVRNESWRLDTQAAAEQARAF